MRIEHLAFYLTLTIGLVHCDEELQERANRFIKERLVPLLRRAQVKKLDLNRLRLCKCTGEAGCNRRTGGFLHAVEGLLPEETAAFNVSCFTDGVCFQTTYSSSNDIPNLYGCIDLDHMTKDDFKFHDRIEPTCQNSTTHQSHCCDNENFCANEEQIPLPPPLTSWVVFSTIASLIAVVLLVVVVGGALCFIHKKKMTTWYRRSECNDVEDCSVAESSSRNNHLNDLSGTGVTVSTSVGEDYSADQLQTQAINMILALEETSGSGAGPCILHQSTIGHQVAIHGKIGSGGFGSVSVGTFRGEQVAVKVFKTCDEKSYYHEVAIYETNMLRHSNVLRYIGSDRVEARQTTEMWLVTEYHPNGSLHDFLEKNIITLNTWFRLMRSAANGLDFLHCNVSGISEASIKPTIAHRDVKSRNIMVKHDLTCALGDLGLSLASYSEKLNLPAGHSLRCGTVRYLAPEILDNTIQAENLDSYLMCDVYSFALVMWEALCRTDEDEIEARESEKVIPYIEWTERDPQDEEMRDVVVTRGLRPTENPGWSTNSEFKKVLEVITTNWNANPTARFTALQTRMRLDNLINKRLKTAKASPPNILTAFVPDPPRRNAKPPKEFEMSTLAPRRTKVHDQETIESRNGQYKGRDEMKDPLLGC